MSKDELLNFIACCTALRNMEMRSWQVLRCGTRGTHRLLESWILIVAGQRFISLLIGASFLELSCVCHVGRRCDYFWDAVNCFHLGSQALPAVENEPVSIPHHQNLGLSAFFTSLVMSSLPTPALARWDGQRSFTDWMILDDGSAKCCCILEHQVATLICQRSHHVVMNWRTCEKTERKAMV